MLLYEKKMSKFNKKLGSKWELIHQMQICFKLIFNRIVFLKHLNHRVNFPNNLVNRPPPPLISQTTSSILVFRAEEKHDIARDYPAADLHFFNLLEKKLDSLPSHHILQGISAPWTYLAVIQTVHAPSAAFLTDINLGSFFQLTFLSLSQTSSSIPYSCLGDNRVEGMIVWVSGWNTGVSSCHFWTTYPWHPLHLLVNPFSTEQILLPLSFPLIFRISMFSGHKLNVKSPRQGAMLHFIN